MAELDNSTKLAMMLASLGNALQGGGDIWSGITRGTNDFFAGMGGLSKMQQDAADKQMMMDYHQAQGRRLDAQTAMEQEKARREAAAIEAYTGGGMGVPGAAPAPGMGVPPSGPTMGPGNLTGSFYDRWAAGESAGNPQAVNPSGAAGRLQVMPQTYAAARTAIPGLPDDPRQTSVAQDKAITDWYTAQAMPVLARSLGRQPTPGELGLSTLAGPAGASALLRLDPNTPIASLPQDFWQRMGEKFTHQTFLAQNPQIAQLGTVGGVADFFKRRFEGGGAPASVTNTPTMTGVQLPGQPPIQLAQAGGALPDVTSTTFGDARPTQPQQPVAPPLPPGLTPPPDTPRPTQVPPEVDRRLKAMVATRQLTIPQAEAERNKYLDGLWQQQQQNARSMWERQNRGYQIVDLPDGSKAMVDTMDPRKPPIPITGAKPPDIKDIDGVRREIEKLPDVASIRTVTPIFGSMIKSSQLNSKTADLDMIYGLAKILDPGSVVREGEMTLVQRTGGIFDQIHGWLSSVNGGAALPPDVRANIMQIAANRIAEIKSAADASLKPYVGLAQRRNWNVDDIMPGLAPLPTFDPKSISTAPRVQGGGGAQPKAPPQIGAVENGYRFKGGDPADRNSWEKVP